jgi:hypothetical protein
MQASNEEGENIMKTKGIKNLSKSLVGVLILALLSSCAKDKQVNTDGIQTEEKNGFAAGKILKKDLTGCEPSLMTNTCIDAQEYLLVRAIEEANGNNPFWAVPGFQFNYGAVKVRITEKTLDFLPSDSFQFTKYGYWGMTRQLVEKEEPIVSFPIVKHFDVGFARNDYGEETNSMQELEEGPIHARKYIRVDWNSPITPSIKMDNVLGGSRYVSELQSSLTSKVELQEDGSFSFDTSSMLSTIFSSDTYSIQSKTTLIKVKESDYSARIYEDSDFEKFGIFRSFRYKLGMQGDLVDDDIQKFATIYNLCPASQGGECSKKVITMHLTKNMPEVYKELSAKAVLAWNKVFQEALGRTDDVLVLSNKEVSVGDVLHNSIAYVDTDFLAGSLLGVSQSTTSPLTGETISSRSTVFGDGIEGTKGAVDRILDNIIANPYALKDFLFDGKAQMEKATASMGHDHSAHKQQLGMKSWSIKPGDLEPSLKLKDAVLAAKTSATYSQNIKKLVSDSEIGFKEKVLNLDSEAKVDPRYISDAEHLGGVEQYLSQRERSAVANNMLKFQDIMLAGSNMELDEEAREILSSKHLQAANIYEKRQQTMSARGIHGAELVDQSVLNFVRASLLKSLKEGLGAGLTDADTLKMIQEMLEKGEAKAIVALIKLDLASGSPLREAMKEEVGKRVFYSTLLHEMGHSFGLRHNFIASVDQENFHPKYHELKAVVDACNGKDTGATCDPTVTKYDLENWAFSSVMDYNAGFHNDLMELGPYDKAAIQYAYNPAKPIDGNFKFCSDEHVQDNMLCNRHDKGLNLAEITLNRIKDYNNRYYSYFFRRGRAFFGNYAGSMAVRYMLPVRTVFDEAIYQLVNARPASPALQQATGCNTQMDAVSNFDAGGTKIPEFMVNTCDNAALEVFLLQNRIPKKPTDLDAVEYAVNLNLPISEFTPMGRADLALSSLLAKNFFRDIMGSGEPGAYLPETVDGKPVLTMIPGSIPLSATNGNTNAFVQSAIAGLQRIANDRNLDPNAFVNANLMKIANVDIGEGRYYKSMATTSAGVTKVQNIGSIYEKYYAMAILGTRYLPVPKYYQQSLNGNVYLWPQTREFAVDVFSKLIQMDKHIAPVRYQSIDGSSGVGIIESAQDKNTQFLASIYSVISFINDQDKSFYRKVRVFNNITDCEQEASRVGGKKVSVEIQGQVLCAFDDIDGKSIVLPMLSDVKASIQEVDKWRQISLNASEILKAAEADVAKILGEEGQATRDKLIAGAKGFEPVEKALPAVMDEKFSGALTAMPQIPLFNLLKLNTQFQQATFGQVIGALAQFVDQNVEGGIPAFLERVKELQEGKSKAKVSPIQKPVAKKGKIEGESLMFVNASLILSGELNKSEEEKEPTSSDKISDEELTRIAQFYIDLSDYMSEVGKVINQIVEVRASDILLDRAISSLDSKKAPLEELIKIVKIYGN